MSATVATASPYDYWRAVLAGKKPSITETGYQTGFYFMRRVKGGPRFPVAIWQDEYDWVFLVDGDQILNKHAMPRIWMSCARHAITEEAYNHRVETGVWMDEAATAAPAGSKSNLPTDPFERLKLELAGAEESAGGIVDIKTQAAADSAQNLRDKASGLASAIEALRKAEAKPIDEAKKAVQAKYLPFIERAERVVLRLRGYLTIFHNAERDRLQKEAAAEQARLNALAGEENARRRAEADMIAEATGDEVDIEEVAAPKVEAAKTIAGGAYGRRSGLRSKTFVVIEDYEAALNALKDHPIVVAAVEQAATAIVIKAKGKVPGVTKKTEHVA